jgi:signal transduction histidine kinase
VRRWQRGRVLEAVAMVGTVIVLAEFATRSDRPLTYLVFPVLIWGALRFGQRGATLAVAVTALFTVWNTIHYLGPFHFDSVTRSVLNAQLFIAVSALTTLSLAAVVSEREEFARRLGASRLRLVAAADNARRRLEQDLHDGAQLRLTWLAVQLRDAAELSRLNPERAAVVIGEAESELELAIDELRELAHGIHPAVLVDLGLAEAVKSLVLHSDIPVTLVELPSSRLDETAETIAYYIVAEAIANAQKYSRASSIQVRIVAGVDRLRIEVLDDGVGDAAERPGSGLEGLRDRAEAIGGTMELRSRTDEGTRVVVQLPASRGD